MDRESIFFYRLYLFPNLTFFPYTILVSIIQEHLQGHFRHLSLPNHYRENCYYCIVDFMSFYECIVGALRSIWFLLPCKVFCKTELCFSSISSPYSEWLDKEISCVRSCVRSNNVIPEPSFVPKFQFKLPILNTLVRSFPLCCCWTLLTVVSIILEAKHRREIGVNRRNSLHFIRRSAIHDDYGPK
ncbi:PREDICTED: uncharacterized protein LOC104719295 [Camelina sativa]|uniref:Uncharacterized protein LOC104719295 n=1 Tax=Camelina sativa TaxID=90675 RepID=A0ABM1QHB7_CAMSA|nr:PREDICTED: uncharacterized protein LOC104719295 [Camelina sativa]